MAKKPMTKPELMEAVAEKAGYEKKTVGSVIDALSEVILAEANAGGAVTLPGVGKISARDRAARTTRNPRTGEAIHKAADRAPKMTFSKTFKDVLNP